VHDDQPTDLERRALDAWTPAEPPHGFADRVVAAAAAHDHADKVRDVPPVAAAGRPLAAVRRRCDRRRRDRRHRRDRL
jgi:hypothetical protein